MFDRRSRAVAIVVKYVVVDLDIPARVIHAPTRKQQSATIVVKDQVVVNIYVYKNARSQQIMRARPLGSRG